MQQKTRTNTTGKVDVNTEDTNILWAGHFFGDRVGGGDDHGDSHAKGLGGIGGGGSGQGNMNQAALLW
jgi:hypothetical protein